jgi:hypothetical protein
LRASVSYQALTHEQAELIASAIKDDFISTNRFYPPRYLNILAIRVVYGERTMWKRGITGENDYLEEFDQLDESGDNFDDENDVELVDEDEALFDESRQTAAVDSENLWGQNTIQGFRLSAAGVCEALAILTLETPSEAVSCCGLGETCGVH